MSENKYPRRATETPPTERMVSAVVLERCPEGMWALRELALPASVVERYTVRHEPADALFIAADRVQRWVVTRVDAP